ncbi:hypothetical protein [Micromonospora sp. NPDC023956]|uniref:hypothetical protein n=1 Tax=Micromonospora sp. NPDC023956 TaxID=3155722 RepID=UPI0033CB42B1
MISRTPAHVAALLCAVLASGCASDDTTTPVAASSSAPVAVTPSFSPSPTSDKDRLACRAVYALPRTANLTSENVPPAPAVAREVGSLAAEAVDTRISQAGVNFVSMGERLAADPDSMQVGLWASKAQIDLFRACVARFGSGPW